MEPSLWKVQEHRLSKERNNLVCMLFTFYFDLDCVDRIHKIQFAHTGPGGFAIDVFKILTCSKGQKLQQNDVIPWHCESVLFDLEKKL